MEKVDHMTQKSAKERREEHTTWILGIVDCRLLRSELILDRVEQQFQVSLANPWVEVDLECLLRGLCSQATFTEFQILSHANTLADEFDSERNIDVRCELKGKKRQQRQHPNSHATASRSKLSFSWNMFVSE